MPCYLVISESREFWRVDEERKLAMNWTIETWEEDPPKDIRFTHALMMQEGEHLSIATENGDLITTNSPVFKIIELPRDQEYAKT